MLDASMLLVAAILLAQAPPEPPSVTSNALGLDSSAFVKLQERINGRPLIRVQTSDARLLMIHPTITLRAIHLSTAPDSTTGVDLSRVTRIHVQGRATRTGAKLGVILGGVMGGVIGARHPFGTNRQGPCGQVAFQVCFDAVNALGDGLAHGGTVVASTAVGTVAGMVTGAVVGALAGSRFAQWRPLYDRGRNRRPVLRR